MTTIHYEYLGHHIRNRTLGGYFGDISGYSDMIGQVPKSVNTIDWNADDWHYINDVMLQYPDNLIHGKDIKKGLARLILLHQKNLEQYKDNFHGYDLVVRGVIQNFVNNVSDITLWGEFLSHHSAQIIHEYEFLSAYEQRYLMMQLATLCQYPYRNGYGYENILLKEWIHHLAMIDNPSESDRDCHIKCLIIAFLTQTLSPEADQFDSLGVLHEGVFDSSYIVEAYDIHTAFLSHLLHVQPDEFFLDPHEHVWFEQLKLLGEYCDIQTWLNIDAIEITDHVGVMLPLSHDEIRIHI